MKNIFINEYGYEPIYDDGFFHPLWNIKVMKTTADDCPVFTVDEQPFTIYNMDGETLAWLQFPEDAHLRNVLSHLDVALPLRELFRNACKSANLNYVDGTLRLDINYVDDGDLYITDALDIFHNDENIGSISSIADRAYWSMTLHGDRETYTDIKYLLDDLYRGHDY